MATMKDVAKEASVSVGTVSRYLNGNKLKKENERAIEMAITKLNYMTNAVARSMKTGKTMTVAVIVPYLANMFSMRVIESVEKVLQKDNYCVIISDCAGDAGQELERLAFLRKRMVDGFVLMPSGNDSKAMSEMVGGIPLVLIDRTLDYPVFDSVVIDNEKMTYDYVCRLLDKGIRKIGIIEGPDRISTARQRRIGYEKALKKYGISKDYYVQCDEFLVQNGYQAAKELMRYNLEAIFASNYELSAGAVDANDCDNLQILGFDNLDILPKYVMNYTGIHQPIEKIGELAANILMKRFQNPSMAIQNIVI